ncbi:Protein phosphatase 1 regulatory subunit 3B [Echinococcus multilocularis]|uniref:Protein phosphatase 1 regulatory subunit 3B n=1 Tax=Echinococcus multilocularis TaxID=6211 RepID=A0A068YAW1_ECHMU|nr:Protein phosphatase 1 regulatory subunit 3B [Echinococcus multilocularis]
MVSELGLIYSAGRHWTGSMIELGYGHRESTFKTTRNWMASVDKSTFSCLARRSEDNGDTQRELITSRLILEQFLEATSNSSTSCGDIPDGSASRCVLPSSIARYLLEIIKEKAGFRHSLTSLLPTEIQESTQCYVGYEFRHRKVRCRSCEPQSKGPQLGNPTLSSFLFERFVMSRQQQQRCPISPPRKRLSLSDSEICYTKDLAGSTEHEPVNCNNTKSSQKSSVESSLKTVEVAASPEEPKTTPVFVAGEEITGTEEVANEATSLDSPPVSKESEATLFEALPTEVPKTSKKKTVRFADDIGDALFQERVIIDTALPPTLHLERPFSFDDDFRDMGDLDDSLRGVVRPVFKALGPKHNSLPDIMKVPPPLPKLHHSNSSSGTLTLSALKSPPSLTSPTNGAANWRLTFAQPAAQYLAFRQRLESNYVSLENVSMANQKDGNDNLYLYGTIKVKNITFEKHVKLRVTFDRWASYKDYPAVHNAQLSGSSGNPPYDTFMFNFSIEVSKMPEPRELQFAVCFQAGPNGSNGEYWDNNDGCNYVVVEEAVLMPSQLLGNEEFFRNRPSRGTGESPMRTAVGGTERSPFYSSPPVTVYTQDYRPNFNDFSSLTCYSSWQHYASESMYY